MFEDLSETWLDLAREGPLLVLENVPVFHENLFLTDEVG